MMGRERVTWVPHLREAKVGGPARNFPVPTSHLSRCTAKMGHPGLFRYQNDGPDVKSASRVLNAI